MFSSSYSDTVSRFIQFTWVFFSVSFWPLWFLGDIFFWGSVAPAPKIAGARPSSLSYLSHVPEGEMAFTVDGRILRR